MYRLILVILIFLPLLIAPLLNVEPPFYYSKGARTLASSLSPSAQNCQTLMEEFLLEFLYPTSRKPLRILERNSEYRSHYPIVVAHGKNTNIAVESTWKNFVHAFKSQRDRLSGLEVDLRLTSEGEFVITHDPTFHRLMQGYQTSNEARERFRSTYPDIARDHEGQWDFDLFDESAGYTLKELQEKFAITDPASEHNYPVLSLNQLLNATTTHGKFIVPEYKAKKFTGETTTFKSEVVDLPKGYFIYLDIKPLVHYPRRLLGLSDYHWIMGKASNEELEKVTLTSLKSLSRSIKRYNAYDRCFFVARHKEVARLSKQVDPKMKFMVSTELVDRNDPVEKLISEFENYLPLGAELFEVKYLKHILDPQLLDWAKSKGVRLFYNEIIQTDPGQFEGIYKDNLDLLYRAYLRT